MANGSSIKKHRWLSALLLALVLLSGCSATPTPTVATSTTPGADATGPAATATDAPTEPPPASPEKMLVIADPASSDPQQAARTGWLREFAEQNDLVFEVRPVLETSGLSDEIRLVIFLEPVGDLSPLLAAAPQAQFVLIGGEEAQAGDQVSVILVEEAQIAFLAGYIAEMIAVDFRAAGLFPAERGDLAEAFQNGGQYLCGRCVPIYAPVVFFPLIGSAPAGSPAAMWISAFDEVHKNRIQTVFLSRQAASHEIIANLSQQEIVILGETAPPEELRSAWAATIQVDVDEPLRTLLSGVLNGSGGQSLRATLVMSNVNENRITPGKQQLIQQVIDDLAGGWIYPLSVPLE